MSKRIIISVSSDLATDQRVQKVAKSCHDRGYDVLLVGRFLKNSKKTSFPYNYKRFHLCFNHSFLFYAELNIRLFFFLLFSTCDILLSNDTDTLPANYYAAKLRGKKLVFDAHELFPEVPELVNRQFVKKFWENIENHIFPKLKCSYTVCQSIADYYNTKYGMKMTVIKNVPYLHQSMPKPEKKDFKTIIYQGALNKGRGLESVIRAMQTVSDAKLIIIGDGDIRSELEELTVQMSLQGKVQFLGKILPDDLKSFTLNADLGLCLLDNLGLSYYYSLPNRIFDYLHAGIPVLASDFPEIRKIVETYKTGVLVSHHEPEYLSRVINEILQKPFDTSQFSEIAKIFCWEEEEKILMQKINN